VGNRRLLAGAAALAASVVFGCSVVWYFAHWDGTILRHDAAAAIGTNAYVLAMLALLVLVPVRHLPGRGADRGRSPARIAVGTAVPD
jgi:hypothetical protein